MKIDFSTIFTGIAIAFFVVALQDAKKETLENFVIASLISVPLYVFLNTITKAIIKLILEKRIYNLSKNLKTEEVKVKLLREMKIVSTTLILINLAITILITKTSIEKLI